MVVIAGIVKGFGNGVGMKGRNIDWEIKSKSFLIGEEKEVSCRSKNEFYNLELLGWSHKNGEDKPLIKNLYP
jgi:hypothetical protein